MAADHSHKASLTTAAGLKLNSLLRRLRDLAHGVQRHHDEVTKRPTSTAVVREVEVTSGSRMHVFAGGHASSAWRTSATARLAPMRVGTAVSTAVASSITTTIATSHSAEGSVVLPGWGMA